VIPYIQIPSLPLIGGLAIHPFGVLVAAGVCMGWWFIRKRAPSYGISDAQIAGAMTWAVVAGFVGAHLVEALFYKPDKLQRDGLLALLKFDGLSSFGGFFGAAVGLTIWVRRNRQSWLKYGDLIVQGLVVGWIFGRAGCFLAHDHPGARSAFFLAVQYPGGPRHDLGLYEFLFTLLFLLPVMLWMNRRVWRPGTYLAVMMLLYAPVRFGLDFLRATDVPNADPRTLGLTAGHYSALLLLAMGAALLAYRPRAAVPVPKRRGK
jgi:phosphatidylglycerol:prolipoprotein diacylglycerol transferase